MPGRDGTGPYGTGLRGGRGYGHMRCGYPIASISTAEIALEAQVKNLMQEIEQIKEQLKK